MLLSSQKLTWAYWLPSPSSSSLPRVHIIPVTAIFKTCPGRNVLRVSGIVCVGHLNNVNQQPPSLISNWGDRKVAGSQVRRIGWKITVMLFCSKSMWTRTCEKVCCCDAQPVLLLPKSRVMSLYIFMQLLQNDTIEDRIDCLACYNEFFVYSALDVKGNDELFTCLASFDLSEIGLFHWENCCFVSWT